MSRYQTNMTIEKQQFEDVSPVKDGDFPANKGRGGYSNPGGELQVSPNTVTYTSASNKADISPTKVCGPAFCADIWSRSLQGEFHN